jgi:hypothetical protein
MAVVCGMVTLVVVVLFGVSNGRTYECEKSAFPEGGRAEILLFTSGGWFDCQTLPDHPL